MNSILLDFLVDNKWMERNIESSLVKHYFGFVILEKDNHIILNKSNDNQLHLPILRLGDNQKIIPSLQNKILKSYGQKIYQFKILSEIKNRFFLNSDLKYVNKGFIFHINLGNIIGNHSWHSLDNLPELKYCNREILLDSLNKRNGRHVWNPKL